MYWCNSKTLRTGIMCGLYFILILPACKPAIKQKINYFDVKGFFGRESSRLTKLNKPVYKTVYHNGVTENKKIHIDSWDTEFGLFSGSDINRPAWLGSYHVISEGNIIIYKAKDPELTTQEILIKKTGDKVEYMLIYNHTKNLLYTNDEELSYFPDSLYQINKTQTVRLLGTNKYQIKGFFNQR